MSDFSIQLRQLRKAQGYTQQQLADLLGISKSAVSMYESAVREPDLALLHKMAVLLAVDINTLLGSESVSREDLSASPFQNMKKLIARNGNRLTDEERNKLIDLLTNCNL